MYKKSQLNYAVLRPRLFAGFIVGLLMLGLTAFGQKAHAQVYVISKEEWVHRCANCICQECAKIHRVSDGHEEKCISEIVGQGPGTMLVIHGGVLNPIVIERLQNHGVKVIVCRPAYQGREYHWRRKFIEELAVAMAELCPDRMRPIELAKDLQMRLISIQFFRTVHGIFDAT